jgi:ribosomal protein S27E
MTDPTSGSAPQCPWCSAVLAAPGAEQCSSCGAQLVSAPGADTDIKGVTTLDAEAILRARSASSRPRSGLLALITGDEAEAASAREHQESLAQPSGEVRREMARLEMEARRTDEEAERTALRAAAMAQLGITVDDLAAAEAAAMAGHEAGLAPADLPAPNHDAAAPDDDAAAWPAELHPVDDAPAAEVPAEAPSEEP